MDELKENMTFSEALESIKYGNKVCRSGWNGKGMFIYLSEHDQNAPVSTDEDGKPYKYLDCIMMKTANNELVPWLASQTDVLSDDWMEL